MEVGADGLNGDTLDGVNSTWWEEGQRRGYPVVLEPEVLYSNLSYLQYNHMSWAYWTGHTRTAPHVSTYKAVTSGLHLIHYCERAEMDHTDGIQQAFFNGAGFESWENVWGVFNKVVERDGELLREYVDVTSWE